MSLIGSIRCWSGILLLGLTLLALVACGVDPEPTAGGVENEESQPDTALAEAEGGGSEALPPPPRLEDFQYELHGQLQGKPFWLRIEAKSEELGGLRLLHLQYTAPAKEQTGGALLIDYPLLAVTDQVYISGWKDENDKSLAAAYYLTKKEAYQITREIERVVGEDVFPETEEVTISSAPAWDRHLAPLFLALLWQEHGKGEVAVLDFFAGAEPAKGTLRWQGLEVHCLDDYWVAVADDQGRLHKLQRPDGTDLLVVEGRAKPLTKAEAAARKQKIAESGSPD